MIILVGSRLLLLLLLFFSFSSLSHFSNEYLLSGSQGWAQHVAKSPPPAWETDGGQQSGGWSQSDLPKNVTPGLRSSGLTLGHSASVSWSGPGWGSSCQRRSLDVLDLGLDVFRRGGDAKHTSKQIATLSQGSQLLTVGVQLSGHSLDTRSQEGPLRTAPSS